MTITNKVVSDHIESKKNRQQEMAYNLLATALRGMWRLITATLI